MDYCKFENTYHDFSACVAHLEQGRGFNQYEKTYKDLLYQAAKEYIEAYENYVPRDEDEED